MAAYRNALVTGASGGIGECFARHLASAGHDLVLVARREERLHALAAELKERHPVQVEVLAADLGDEEQLAEVERRLTDDTSPVDLLVNNAGVGASGPFASCPVAGEEETVRVNVLALTRLAHAALRTMRERRRGGMINVSSVAGLMVAFPNSATYGASKAYVYSLSESLRLEAKPYGVHVTAVCPGYVRTDMTVSIDNMPKYAWTPPEKVVVDAVRAVENGDPMVIPGGLYKAAGILIRLLPRSLIRLAAQDSPG